MAEWKSEGRSKWIKIKTREDENEERSKSAKFKITED